MKSPRLPTSCTDPNPFLTTCPQSQSRKTRRESGVCENQLCIGSQIRPSWKQITRAACTQSFLCVRHHNPAREVLSSPLYVQQKEHRQNGNTLGVTQPGGRPQTIYLLDADPDNQPPLPPSILTHSPRGSVWEPTTTCYISAAENRAPVSPKLAIQCTLEIGHTMRNLKETMKVGTRLYKIQINEGTSYTPRW